MYQVTTDNASPEKSVNPNMFTRRTRIDAVIRDAQSFVIDYGAKEVIVYRDGKQAGVYNGAFWRQVTDDRLQRALDRLEGESEDFAAMPEPGTDPIGEAPLKPERDFFAEPYGTREGEEGYEHRNIGMLNDVRSIVIRADHPEAARRQAGDTLAARGLLNIRLGSAKPISFDARFPSLRNWKIEYLADEPEPEPVPAENRVRSDVCENVACSENGQFIVRFPDDVDLHTYCDEHVNAAYWNGARLLCDCGKGSLCPQYGANSYGPRSEPKPDATYQALRRLFDDLTEKAQKARAEHEAEREHAASLNNKFDRRDHFQVAYAVGKYADGLTDAARIAGEYLTAHEKEAVK